MCDVFRLADTPSRNVVQVLSRDEKDVKGQWTFVQAERPEVSQDQVIMFKEAREGTTLASFSSSATCWKAFPSGVRP